MARVLSRDPECLPPISPDGRLAILRRDGPGTEATVLLQMRNPVQNASAPIGRPAGAVPWLVRRQIPVGGWTQALARLSALERAAGRMPDPSSIRARALLAQAEVAVVLVAQACLDWPRLVGEEPQLRTLRYAQAALEALIARLWRGCDPADAGAVVGATVEADLAVSALIEAVETAVLPRAPADPLQLPDWAARASAPLARLIRAASRLRLGAEVPPGAPVPSLPALARAMASEPSFAHAPHVAGRPGDPTPFARMPPLPGAGRFGPVGARLLARAAQAQAVIEALARLDPPAITLEAPEPGAGAAMVEGPRGPHACLVRSDRDGGRATVSGIAPAQWMQHPSGPLAATLAALPRARFMADAPLVLAAFDPCAAIALRHEEAMGA